MSLINNFFNKKISEYINREININIDPGSIVIKDEKFKELENRIWYDSSSANEIETFYKTNYPSGGLINGNEFYRKVRGKTPRIHVPVARIITDTTVNLVFSEMPKLTVETGNKKTNQILNDEISKTLNENESEDLFKKIGTMVSYSGACGIKLTIDKEFSDYIIAQPYPKEDLEICKKYGRVSKIKFIDYLDDGYILKTIDEPGHRYFELYNKDGKLTELSRLEETSELHDWYLLDNDGKIINTMMSVYIENINGKSDYDGCIDLFQLMDEIKSSMNHIERSLKPKRSIPSSLCEIDRESGKKVIPDDWDREDTIVEVEDPESQIKNINEMSFNSPDLNSYQALYDRTFKDILNTVSLSESTLGNNDGGSDSSSLALNIREKSSLRKRATLITKYDKAFRQLTKLILLLNHATLLEDKMITEDFSKYDYFVDFSEYNSPSFDQMVEVLNKALSSGLISRREAIKELYEGEMSKEEQEKMLSEINEEKGKNNVITEEDKVQ